MSVKITDNRAAFDRLIRELKRGGGQEVVAGIQQGAVKDGLQVAEYARWNEFGTARIPARPFMRTAFDTGLPALERFTRQGMGQVIDGNTTFSQFLTATGVWMQTGIKESILTGNWTPNATYTIARKKSAKPLIDSGTMLNSVTFAVQKQGTAEK